MPAGGEAAARSFYGEILGMTELQKPSELASRGGCWFESGIVQVHLGVEAEFRAARKAHPGLRCSSYETLLARLREHGLTVNEDDAAGSRRAFVDDPFGNRIELVAERAP